MQLMIEIDENEYLTIKNHPDNTTSYLITMHLYEAVIKGTPVDLKNFTKERCYIQGYVDGKKDTNEQTGWIPVSEKVPNENGWYRCTAIINDVPLTLELFYKNGKWLDNQRIDMFNRYDIYGYGKTSEKHKLSYQELISEFEWTEIVIAWMPLPDAYEESEVPQNRDSN